MRRSCVDRSWVERWTWIDDRIIDHRSIVGNLKVRGLVIDDKRIMDIMDIVLFRSKEEE